MSQYDYIQTRDDIIKRALRLIGVLAQGESPTTDQVSEAATALNGLVKAWQADGMPLWAIKTYTMPLKAGKKEYNIGETQVLPDIAIPKPLKVLQAWYHNNISSVDVPLRIVTQQQYNMLGNKDVVGLPIQIWYHPKVDYGTMTVYEVPDQFTEDNITLTFVYQAPFKDFDSATDVPDFPQEWFDAITYGLACRIAPEYGVAAADRKTLFQEMTLIRQDALNFGLEEGSLYFQIDRRSW